MTYPKEDVAAVATELESYPCPSCKRRGFAAGSLVLRTNYQGKQFFGCSNWHGWGCAFTVDMPLAMSIYYAGVDKAVLATPSSDCVAAINQLTSVLRLMAQQVPQRKTRTKKGKRNVSRR